MRALQISELTGPRGLTVTELPDPGPEHPMTPGQGVVIDVHAAGVAFPDVLQTRGEYQFKPPLPFVPGAEVAGVVREASDGASVSPGDRVAACTYLGGFADVAVAPAHMTFPLDDALDFEQGASLIFNYHTVVFALRIRGRLQEGERVLVHGAAGGVGSAALQVAKGLGAETVAVVSSDAKAAVAEQAGADMVLRSDGDWKDAVKESGGVDVVLDPVGGDRFTDSLRCLREAGRVVVVGFTGGSIPEVKVNRLLLNNTEVIGAGWGAWVMPKPQATAEIGAELDKLVAAGSISPIVGASFPLEQGPEALELIDSRGATGKIVLTTGR